MDADQQVVPLTDLTLDQCCVLGPIDERSVSHDGEVPVFGGQWRLATALDEAFIAPPVSD